MWVGGEAANVSGAGAGAGAGGVVEVGGSGAVGVLVALGLELLVLPAAADGAGGCCWEFTPITTTMMPAIKSKAVAAAVMSLPRRPRRPRTAP